jgi:hypothetical protein
MRALNSLTVAVCDDLLTNPRNLTEKLFHLLNNSNYFPTPQIYESWCFRATFGAAIIQPFPFQTRYGFTMDLGLR